MTKQVFYISASGNDANNGLTEQSPWQSIDKINNVELKPGDQILFHCGDTFSGQIDLKYSGTQDAPIIISSYGVGNMPIISGSVSVQGWSSIDKNIVGARFENKVHAIFVNNEKYNLARIPASGFFTIENGDKRNLIDNRNLNFNFSLAGATARIRAINWQYETAKVEAHTDGKITFADNMMYQCSKHYGYVLDNKYEFLTSKGQWYWDEIKKELFIIPFSDQGLAESNVEASVFEIGINIQSGISHIQIKNLQFEKFEKAAIWGNSATSYIEISNSKINDCTVFGIYADINSNHYLIENNIIEDILGRGICSMESSYNSILRNVVSRIGLKPGYGFDGVNNGIGIAVLKTEVMFKISQNTLNQLRVEIKNDDDFEKIRSYFDLPYPDDTFLIEHIKNENGRDFSNKYCPLIVRLIKAEMLAGKLDSTQNKVAFNVVDQTGYAGIRLDGNNSIAECNVIKNTLLHMNDGGALYCWAQNEEYTFNNILRKNIIINAVGSCEATANDLAYAYGIYTDCKCHHILIEDNTVVGAVGAILINDLAHHQIIRRNTLYDNLYGLVFSEYAIAGTLTDCEATDNIMFAKTRNQRALFVESRLRDGFQPCIYDRNLYANAYYPFPISVMTSSEGKRNFAEYTLAAWQKNFKQDMNSTTIATANHDAGGRKSQILINETDEEKLLPLPNEYDCIDIEGNLLNNFVLVMPYSSIIIIQK